MSIFKFQEKAWSHIIPKQQRITKSIESYFGMPDDEIQQLYFNYKFQGGIFDCFIYYQAKYLRRFKYYNDIGKLYLERHITFEGMEVK
mmetsp:Transcript_5196/g.3898  ORF Transcript_5196/g.3898 Transcript_5196/m.3898 type:complete len:88 (-) Transcript_5196:2439-2702(-)